MMKKVVGYVMSVILALGIMLNAVGCSGSNKTVKVSFVTDCDDVIAPIYFDVGDYYGELPVPQHTDDFKFVGWYPNEQKTGKYITPHTKVSINKDHTLYAKWNYVGKTVTITFRPGNGEEDIVSEYKAGYPFDELPTPSPRAGYAFDGWLKGFSTFLTVEDVAPEKAWSYDAKWTLVGPIPVSFETGCDVTLPALNLMVGEPYGSLPNPVRKDYEFLGWEYMNGTTPEAVTAETLVPEKAQITLTAKWKFVGAVTLSFVSEGESFTPLKIRAGEKLSGLPTPKSRDGYTFLGWYTQDKFYGERISEGDTAPDDNVTLYSRYEKNSTVDESRTMLVAMKDALYSRSFAIKDGKLYVWGNNSQGKLGIDSTDDVVTPTLLTDEISFTEVTAGYNGVYALDSDGNAWMWGTISTVGVTDVNYKTPTRMFEDGVFASPKFKSISAGGLPGSTEQIYAIDSGDKLCKLYREQNDDGEWGWAFTRLLQSRNVKKLSVGSEHALAIDSEGKLWAWGGNRYEQLGDGTNKDKDLPVQIMSDKRFITVSAGKSHTLAIDFDGHLWVWGSSNTDGMRSDYINGIKIYNLPTIFMPEKEFVSVSAGDGFSLAVDGDGKVWSWGSNQYGQLGNGENVPDKSLQKIAEGLTFTEISQIGGNHVLARTTDDKYYSWGDNNGGALGNGTSSVDMFVPTIVIKDKTFKYVYADGDALFMLDTDGRLITWGKSENYGYNNTEPTHVEQELLFRTLSFGDKHILGIDLEGNLWAWGNNTDGQLGDGTKTNKAHPVQIMSGTKFIKISAGGNTSFAIDADGKLWAWGNKKYGQLGNGTATNNTFPEQVKLGSRFIDVCATGCQTYAIDTDGTLWACGAWGGAFAPNVEAIKDYNRWEFPVGYTATFTAISNGISFSSIVAHTTINDLGECDGQAYALSANGFIFSLNTPLNPETHRYISVPIKKYDSRSFKNIYVEFSTQSLYCLDENNCLYNTFNINWGINFNPFEEFAEKKIQTIYIENMTGYKLAIDMDGKLYIWGKYNKSAFGLDIYDCKLSPTEIQIG